MMKHYDDLNSFSKDMGIEAPEHPLFSITFGHKNNGSIDHVVFTAGFYIISFQSSSQAASSTARRNLIMKEAK